MMLRSVSLCWLSLVLASTIPLLGQSPSPEAGNANHTYVSNEAVSNAAAQDDSGGETKPARLEIFGGYSWMNSNKTISGSNGGFPTTVRLNDAPRGFVIDVSYFANRWFGMTVDSGAHFGANYDHAEVLAGPTVRFPSERFQGFVHFLMGWGRLSPINQVDNNAFAWAAGGGFDVKVARHLNIRLAEADYIYAQHNFGVGNPTYVDHVRLSTGLVFLAGVGQELPVSSTCSVDKAEVWAGEPVKATASTNNFNRKHTLQYDWTTNGGKIQGSGESVTIDTAGVADGQSYIVSAHVTDPKDKKAVTSCQASFSTKRRLPPAISCSANPNSVVQGGSITIHSDATSPQGGPVSVTVTSNCGAGGQGTDVSVDTTAMQPGACSVTCSVTDDHQLTASNTASFTVRPQPVKEVPKPPPSLTLRSVYFATAQPTEKNPNAGLVASQQETLRSIAAEFKNYLEVKPDATLLLEAHADPRGGEAYNEKLTERRAARVKSFLVEQGVPADRLETRALGIQHQLTPEEVKQSMEDDPSLTPGEKTRLTRNMRTIVLAANRRVDITLNAPGVPTQASKRQYPFSAADALSLIGGREKPKAAPKTTPKTRPKAAPKTRKKGTK
jgi:outer membrane protein OmpA-like peptidoglycan-associated protein